MFALDGELILSATDLTIALTCEYALLRRADEVLERVPRLEISDPVREHAAALGDLHEQRVLDRYRHEHGTGLVEIEPVTDWTTEQLQMRHEATIAALRAQAPVVAQGSFFDGHVHGRADFLVLTDTGAAGPRYEVVDAKLARKVRSTAILQLGVYADQLVRAQVPVAPRCSLHLGNDVRTQHSTADLLTVLHPIRDRAVTLVRTHAAGEDPVRWGDPRLLACGWCDHCRDAIDTSRDIRLVWGLRGHVLAALQRSGISTIDELARAPQHIEGVSPVALERFRTQARLQLRQEEAQAAGTEPHVFAQVRDLAPLDTLPPPDPGDVFFDFEGDPMWVDADRSEWGLEYLFGVLEAPLSEHDGAYLSFWAHDRAEEKQALEAFLDYLEQRRRDHPQMHVYHYAFYEPATMRKLAARHGVDRARVERVLELFVDLYEVVKRSMHVSQRSYSIKKLEPLYMGEHLRDADGVTDGGASVVAYAEAMTLRDAGDTAGWRTKLDALAEYNAYDCESTMRLRDWLLTMREQARTDQLHDAVSQAAAALGGEAVAELVEPEPALLPEPEPGTRLQENDLLARRLRARAESDPDPALPLLAAALTYHRTEHEPYWAAHRARLSAQASESTDERDVLDVHRAQAGTWEQGSRGGWRRSLVLEGRLGTGSAVTTGTDVFCVYAPPLPHGMQVRPGQVRGTSYATVIRCGRTTSGLDRVELTERLGPQTQPHTMLPVLMTPGPPPRTTTVVEAISAVAREVLGDTEPASTGPLAAAALDLLRRTPPRQVGGGPLPAGPATTASTVREAIEASDRSYVAVQGPPGTGKTRLGAEVIAALVTDRRWRVGVVAQSHTVVEHMLAAVRAAGVPAERIGKRGGGDGAARWRTLSGGGHLDFVETDQGCVLGGTTWDMANRRRVPAGALDLLVIEEAGQYALADAVAAATSAQRLLLLGDPQQLPQVSQARHPAPVDASVLGALMTGHDVLPSELGYFLDRTWRLHPAVCDAVSALAYEGRLISAQPARDRHLVGLAPGVHDIQVPHRGNRARSPEEATTVVAQIQQMLGQTWHDEHGQRPLGQQDVIVVAAYNAQVDQIRTQLAAAGLTEVRVGTVDRFQGQEAVVTIVSLAASTAREAPRGLRFLLDRHRITVALSRGQWAAVIVRSDRLTHAMPTDPGELADLAAFLRLTPAR